MKKILAWILSFFVALSNNVEYTRQNDQHDYVAWEVYELQPDNGVWDYRDQRARENLSSSEVSCRSGTFGAPSPKTVDYGSNPPAVKAFWFIDGVSEAINNIPSDSKEITLDLDGTLIMPYNGYLTTENLQANDCTSMEVICTLNGSDAYRLTITGMERWYCDINRKELVFHTWENPDDNGSYMKFKAGDVLGISVAGKTKVIVNKVSEGQVTGGKCTVQDFFNNL